MRNKKRYKDKKILSEINIYQINHKKNIIKIYKF